MSLDKKYPKSKDARKRMKPYYDSRRFDYTCRHQGSCSYCSNNRQFNNKKRSAKSGKPKLENDEW